MIIEFSERKDSIAEDLALINYQIGERDGVHALIKAVKEAKMHAASTATLKVMAMSLREKASYYELSAENPSARTAIQNFLKRS